MKHYNECSISREQMIEKIFSDQTVIATYGTSEFGVMEHSDDKGNRFVPKTVDYKDLIGKHVVAFTFGYEDQYYLDEFTFGGIKEHYTFFNEQSQPKNDEEKQQLIDRYGYVVVDEEGKNTGIFSDCFTDNIFCCSDADRYTYFFLLD